MATRPAKGLHVVIFTATLIAVMSAGSGRSWAQGTAGTGLAGTAHDFSNRYRTAVGSCTYCHTPHKALKTALLWNHTLSTNIFQWDTPSTTAGTTYPTFHGDTYKGATAKCLSCHDGSVAIGDIAWFKGVKPSTSSTTTHKFAAGDEYTVGYGGVLGGAGTATHPVAMPYPYQQTANTYNGITTGSRIYSDEWQSTPIAPVRIYNDDGSGNITAGPVAGKSGIECTSCHDPHNRATVDYPLLRGTLDGSSTNYLCLKCHIK